MNQHCTFCDCSFPDDAQKCPACGEPNPAWEARERVRLLDIGYESAWPWTGVPSATQSPKEKT